jgi:hypothetical protein
MRQISRSTRVALALAAVVSATPALAATVQRTAVASFGIDSNPCTIASPCRSFNAAIAQTTPGGEVVILDTAGYGPMVIDRAIKVIGPSGVYGGISVLGAGGGVTAGVVINAGDTDTVTLRGLDITGVPTVAPLPLYGINVQNAGVVHVERSTVGNFTQDSSACINVISAKPIQVYINDSFLRECRHGIYVDGTGPDDTSRLTLVVDNTRIEHLLNTTGGGTGGIRLVDAVLATVRNSVIAWGGNGVHATNSNTAAAVRHHIVSTQITRMGNAAILTGGSSGASLHINVENSVITSSNAGLLHGHGQAVFTTNVIASNANSLVDCSGGGAVVQSLGYGGGNGSNAIYLNSDSVLPAGCTAWFTPTQFAGK